MSNPSSFSLQGKVVIQCGGSGRLGRALTSSLVEAGATLIVASRTPPQTLTKAAVETVDVSSEESIAGLRDRALAAHGRIDGLVFNSVIRPMRAVGDPLSKWQASMATNATGLFSAVRTLGDVMAGQGSGSIVAISSIQGMVGSNLWLYEDDPTMTPPPDYFFHKAGMINLVRYFASHYGAKGVRVNAVSPGGIADPDRPAPSTFVRRYNAMTMLGRLAEASDICGGVVFLLSDASRYVTAVNLPVDGGYTAR